MSHGVQQVIYALERSAQALEAQADALLAKRDYAAEFPAADAECMREAIALLSPSLPPADYRERARIEHSEVIDKTNKLAHFVNSTAFKQVDADERQRLHAQYTALVRYRAILRERIDAFPK